MSRTPQNVEIDQTLADGNFVMFGTGYAEVVTTEAEAQFRIAVAGTIRDLRALVRTENTSAISYIKIRKNGSDAMTLTIAQSGGAGIFSNTTDSVSVAVGDLITFRAEMSAGTIRIEQIGTTFEANDGKTYQMGFGMKSDTTMVNSVSTAYRHYRAQGLITQQNSLNTASRTFSRHNFKLINMSAYAVVNTRTTNTSVEAHVNGTNNTTDRITMPAGVTGLQTQDVDIDIDTDDSFGFSNRSQGGSGNITLRNFQFTIQSDTDRQISLWSGQSRNRVTSDGPFYLAQIGEIAPGAGNSDEETVRKFIGAEGVASLFLVDISTNVPNATFDYTVRKNASNTSMTLNIPTFSTGQFIDTTNTVSFDTLDYISIEDLKSNNLSGGTVRENFASRFVINAPTPPSGLKIISSGWW